LFPVLLSKYEQERLFPEKGKGSTGRDGLADKQLNAEQTASRAPDLTFFTSTATGTPSDPTGAVGLDFYIAAWNTSFQIFNKDGTPAAGMPNAASNATVFGSTIGDPIVFYDAAEDRYVLTQFSASPDGFEVAVSQTNDPINDGWHVYSSTDFSTGAFPDYTKFAVWSDAYYVTANINGGVGQVFAIERTEMLNGNPASIQAFDLPGLAFPVGGFYAPQVLSVSDDNLPATGGATFMFQQDDAYGGVAAGNDHFKLWTLDVDWATPANSVMSAATEFPVTAFNGVFDGGSFSNLTQPTGGNDIDALQALIGNQPQFKKFGSYNAAVFSHVVDVGGGTEQAAVRWYEIRQTGDNQPWTLYQEGTYVAPDDRHAWNASMNIDIQGNIGMGYTTMGGNSGMLITSAYTGQMVASSGSGVMDVAEDIIFTSTAGNPSLRYADYSHLTVDPTDGKGFWFVNEVFEPDRANVVGVFQLAPDTADDVGIVSIDTPTTGDLSNAETVTVTVFNFGENEASGFDVTFQIDGGSTITEAFAGTLASAASAQHVFATTADLSNDGQTYSITACTTLGIDEDTGNDCTSSDVLHVLANDVGVTGFTSPVSGAFLGNETVTITIENFGTDDQTGFDVNYILDGGTPVVETVGDNVPAGGSISYSFTQTADLSALANYSFSSSTLLAGDGDPSNDTANTTITNSTCPTESNTTSQSVGPDAGSVTTSVIDFAADVLISDVNVTVDIDHTWDGDIQITLTSPDAVTVMLSDGNGGSGDNYTGTTFDDDAATAIADGTPPYTGSFQPDGSLADFNGAQSIGDWTLTITDNANGDGGTLNSWDLEICTPAGADDLGVSAITAPVSGENLGNETVTVTIENFGTVDQTGFDVNYILDGGTPVVETVGDNVPAGGSISYSFAQTADLSAFGTYNIVSSTLLAGDIDSGNDSTEVNVTNSSCETLSNTTAQPVGPDAGTVTTSIINFTDDFVLDDVNVTVDIEHTWDGDMQITLTSPDDVTVMLSDGNGGSGDNYTGTTFDDAAATAIADGAPPYSGSFQPDGSLADFNGLQSAGDWTLTITDNANGDGGTLNSWDLQLCGNPNLSIDEFSLDGDLQVIYEGDNQFLIKLTSNSINERLGLRVYNVLGQSLLYRTIENTTGHGFEYRLDMSYAASGMYFVRLGNSQASSIKRIIVD
jgi:subtilisin-like proprotein convertase family protein